MLEPTQASDCSGPPGHLLAWDLEADGVDGIFGTFSNHLRGGHSRLTVSLHDPLFLPFSFPGCLGVSSILWL